MTRAADYADQLSADAAAQIAGVDWSTMRQWCRSGLPHVFVRRPGPKGHRHEFRIDYDRLVSWAALNISAKVSRLGRLESTTQFAARFDVSANTVRRWAKQDHLPHRVSDHDGQILIDPRAALTWLWRRPFMLYQLSDKSQRLIREAFDAVLVAPQEVTH